MVRILSLGAVVMLLIAGCAGPNTSGGTSLKSMLTTASSDVIFAVRMAGVRCGFSPVVLQSGDSSRMQILTALDIGSGSNLSAGIMLLQYPIQGRVAIDEYDPKAYHKDGTDLSPAARTSCDCFEKELERALPGVFYRHP